MSDCVSEFFIIEYEYSNCAMDNRNFRLLHGDNNGTDVCAKIKRDIEQLPSGKQFIFGATLGLVTGYTATKFGKSICIIAGSMVIVLQLAALNNYIQFNFVRLIWDDSDNVPRNEPIESRQQPAIWRLLKGIKNFLLAQPHFTSGCFGGFLIGLGLS